ncbi:MULTISPECIES: DNA primase family protein [unclassified Lonepinella]|uniref:DNA primase family protein n=1 Tax=unclassified Lonepinella TaxID=2642006 RepID=UPI0036DB6A7E
MMNGRLKKAPNLKELIKQNPAPSDEIFILTGANVWAFYRKDPKDGKTDGQGIGYDLLNKANNQVLPESQDYKPIILDERQLTAELHKLELLPEQTQAASLIDISGFFALKANANGSNIRHNNELLSRLCQHLAKTARNLEKLCLKDSLGQLQEDLSGYIKRIRDEEVIVLTAPELIELDADTLKKSNASERAEYFLKWFNKPLAYHPEQGIIYGYNGIIWQVIDDNQLQRLVKDFFAEYGAKYGSATTLKNVIDCLNVDLPYFQKTDEKLLAFKNGVLNKHTLEFMPHKQEHYLTGFNNCDYLDRALPTPIFDKYLDFIGNHNEDRKKALLGALYMILNVRNDWQLTLELIGEAGSGKSTFLEVAKLISGDNNHAAIDLEIIKDPKAIDMILNKSFLYSADQPKYIGDASIIKKISGGDEITFNPKNKKSFSAKVNAIIAICSNTLPIYKHDGGGMERRRVLFPFYQAVEESDKDPNLIAKLQLELGGIIRKIYDTFSDPNEAKQALLIQKNSQESLEMKRNNDHVLEFSAEFELMEQVSNKGLIIGSTRGSLGIDSDLICDRLYWLYLAFCEVRGIDQRSQLKPNDLFQALIIAFKTSGHKIKLTKRTIGGGYNHTNAILKDKEATLKKWRNS